MASVELRRVSKVFPGSTKVLDQVDVCVEDGELLVLLGPNGSGKTTLLRLIAGLERVTAGEVLLGGQVVNGWAPRRRNVAMVFQSGVLYPHLTVEQNLKFGFGNRDEGGGLSWIWSQLTNRPRPSGAGNRSDVPDRQIPQDQQVLRDRVREMAQLLGITSLLNRLPRQLSGGERQRVALGRALVRQPAVFLLDEPAANADAELRQELRVAFHRARQRFPGTMILVSHDHTEALALGQRIAVLGQGKIQQIGSAREVYDTPRNRFVAEFMGRSSTSFFSGEWQHEHETTWFVTPFGRLTAPDSIVSRVGDQVTLGLRSDALTVRHAVGTLPAATNETDWPRANWPGVVRWVELRAGGSVAYVALRRLTEGTPRYDESSGTSKSSGAAVADEEGIVVARVPTHDVMHPGDRVWVEVDLDRTFWFDARTGHNLAVPR